MSQATLNGVQSTPRKSSKAATIPRETDKKDRSASTQPKVEVRDTIWKAAERGNTEAVATFLKKKKSLINAQNESGHTAIHMAALHNCWGVVELLVQQGVDLTVSDNSGWSIFHFAASGRNEKLFRLILEQEKIPSVNAKNEGGNSPIHYLAKNLAGLGTTTAKLLIDKGAELNAQNNQGETPLHGAALKGHYLMIDRLVEYGASPNIPNSDGETPLNWATRHGHERAISSLLKALSRKSDGSADDVAQLSPQVERLESGSKVLYELSFMGSDFDVTLHDDNWDQTLFEGGCELLNRTTLDHSTKGIGLNLKVNPHFDAVKREELPLSKLFHLYLVISGRQKTDPEIVKWISNFLTGPKRAYLLHLIKNYSYRIRVKPPGSMSRNSSTVNILNTNARIDFTKKPERDSKDKYLDIWGAPSEADRKIYEDVFNGPAPSRESPRRLFSEPAPQVENGHNQLALSLSPDTPPGGALRDRAYSLLEHRKMNRFHWEIDIYDIGVLEKIGSGSFGTVYKAEWMGVQVALKKLDTQDLSAAEYRSFLNEMSMMSNLRHPNVLTLLGGCLEPPNVCYITEFMVQSSLDRVLRLYPHLDWKVRVSMALGAAKGLLYLHRQKPPIMHRDMKSLNILVDENFHVKLADFGLSFDKNNNLNTRMGTLNWVAPEILEGSTVYDEKADIYSFGLVLWEILTGKTPFEGKSQLQVIRMIDMREHEKIPDSADPDYARTIRACWDENPKKRPSIHTIVQWLEQIQAKYTPQPPVQ